MIIKYSKTIYFILLVALSLNLKSQRTILWEVTTPENNHISYLLGTYHALGNHFLDSIPIIKNKLLESELAIFECVDGDKTAYDKIVLKRKEDFAYKESLDSNYLYTLDSISQKWYLPLSKLSPNELYIKLRRTYSNTHCNNTISTDSFDHFDNYLLHISKQNNILTYGLETNKQQLKNFKNSFPKGKWKNTKDDIYFIIDALNKNEDNSFLCSSSNNYQNFRNKYRFSWKCDNFMKNKKRNKKWLKILPKKLSKTKCFIAVGIAHLQWECGLINQLRELGFTIEPVSLSE